VNVPGLRSLKHRLLLLTLVTAGLALVVAGLVLSALFREHVRQQFIDGMGADLDQLIAPLEVDARGLPTLDASRLSGPRWGGPRSAATFSSWSKKRPD